MKHLLANMVAKKAAAAVTVAVVSVGGVAAAAPGVLPGDAGPERVELASAEEDTTSSTVPVDTTAAPTTSSSTSSTTTTTEVSAEEPAVTVTDGFVCPEDAENHGEVVSGVARDKDELHGRDHAAAVRAAAHSDCGKHEVDELDEVEAADQEIDVSDDETENDETENDETDHDETDDDETDDDESDDDEVESGDLDGHPGRGRGVTGR